MQGSLGEFRLAEILQLVAVQQKTGLLRMVRGKTIVTFYFDHGILVSCRDRRHLAYDPLLEFLSRYGFLQPQMVEYLRNKIEESKEDLADVLIGERFLTEEELLLALEDMTQELAHRTFTWREGTYQFIGGDEALSGLRHRVSMKIDALLMEGARRADEWPRLVEKLPGHDVVLDAVTAPTVQLGRRAVSVLGHLTEIMRLGDLVARARIPEFDVYEIIVQAMEADIVHVLEKPEPVRAAEPQAVRPRPLKPRLERSWTLSRPLGWSLALAVSICAALGAWVVHPRLRDARAAPAAQALAAEQARAQLRTALEVHRCLHGRYPLAVADLAYDQLASSELLQRAAPLRYAVSADGRSCTLSGPPDDPAAR
jgi:hypothetical protein